MSFIEKSNFNEEIAQMFKKSKYYDASINRFYYAFFQLLKQKIDEEIGIIKEEDVKKAGSHNYIFNKYRNYMLKNGADFEELVDMNTSFRELKNLRKKADYSPNFTNKGDAEKAREYFYDLKEIFM